jgi:hypothetical protein
MTKPLKAGVLLADGTPQQVRQSLGDLRAGNHCCG